MQLGKFFIMVWLISYASFVHAWNIRLDVDETKTMQVYLTHTKSITDADVYLTWVDLDATTNRFYSWDAAEKSWLNQLSPMSQLTELPAVENYTIPHIENSCPDTHRCYLAFVAVEKNKAPLNPTYWQHSNLLPLSLAAAQHRLYGQSVFIDPDYVNRNPSSPPVPTADKAAEEGANLDSADDGDTSTGNTTEKPDIFKLVGNKIYYANGQAERFQVIDVSNVTAPQLMSSLSLTGSPRELYIINDMIVLVQTIYDQKTYQNSALVQTLTQNEQGQLTIVHETHLTGTLKESRRRNNTFYFITESYQSGSKLTIHALDLDAQGVLTANTEHAMTGYSPVISIFSDYLVIANRQAENYQFSEINVFALHDSNSALRALPILQVEGTIPSEFHLDVRNDQLRFVYGSSWRNREAGSSLAIYDLTTEKPSLLGKVDNIAPNEALFATRFSKERAFVVTYERTDPLWVIDLRDPTQPTIQGELHVPGWSEKLFFNEDRLFAVGIHDQPEADEKQERVRRVAMSLFDVSDPTSPALFSRFIPLLDQKVRYSYSPALEDERALLLEWDNAFAALPISSWETDAGNHLQLVSLANDTLTDLGRIDTSLSLLRSTRLDNTHLAALADQALLTIDTATQPPSIAAQLELARSINWIHYDKDFIWAAARGTQGFYRFYQFSPDNLAEPVKTWNLAQGVHSIESSSSHVVFYKTNPLTIQSLDLSTGILSANTPLTSIIEAAEDKNLIEPTWYNRSQPIVHQGRLYIAEQRPLQQELSTAYTAMLGEQDEKAFYNAQHWILKVLDIQTHALLSEYSIAGMPVGFTESGELITRQNSDKGTLQFHVSQLNPDSTQLLHTQTLKECPSYAATIRSETHLFVTCQQAYYYPEPKVYEEEEGVSDSIAPPPYDAGQTTLYQLALTTSLPMTQQWELKNSQNVLAITADTALISENQYYMYDDVAIDVDVPMQRTSLPYYEGYSSCGVYRLTSEKSPDLLKEVNSCYGTDSMALSSNQLWQAEGFKGISTLTW